MSDEIQEKNDKLHFFRLPRELRDKIYDYALYEPEGLFYWQYEDGTANFTRHSSELHAANQLKYTSRQFRQETCGIEIKINKLIFQSHTLRNSKYVATPPAQQFMEFLDMCSESTLQSLRRVHLDHVGFVEEGIESGSAAFLEYMHHVHEVEAFCQVYPSVTVFWQIFPLALESLLSLGTMFGYGLRAEFPVAELCSSLKLEPLWGSASICHNLWHGFEAPPCHLPKHKCDSYVRADNFRILPSLYAADKTLVRNEAWTKMWDWEGRLPDDIFQRRIAKIKDWLANGF
ncbi:hypothetical protein DM02DRAFT_629885 [Periconia macrospinosa]|uniref:Uncharacterized protein n=1 Tax=Periconia macrospinosa TaxID=97972 RepID=A0A2V1DP10_9PLEO|nr:hypothetical protein DM02DRAFT_629885 [Periconia macrospinosa]